ncbi:MAG: hypothetical protein ACEQSX_11865 [Baekduiaceae bacterium]
MVASPAGATTFGSSLVADPAADPVECGEDGCTAVVDLVSPGGGASPVDGVLVGWKRGWASAGAVSILLLRGSDPFTSTGSVAFADVVPGVNARPARVPVRAGDRLAVAGDELPAVFSAAGTGATPVIEARLRNGDTAPATAEIDGELLLQGEVEPDADGDGYGDLTQDGCVGSSWWGSCAAVRVVAVSGGGDLPPGGGPVTHTFAIINDGPGVVAGAGFEISAGATGRTPPVTVEGCPQAVTSRYCPVRPLAPGEEQRVVVQRGVTTRLAETRLRLRPGAVVGPGQMPWQPRGGSASGLTAVLASQVASPAMLRMSLVIGDHVMSARNTTVDVGCPARDVGPCRADLLVRTAWTPKGRSGPVTLVRRRLVMAPGAVSTVRLRFDARAKRWLRGRRSTPVRIRVTRTFGAAGTATASEPARIRSR